MIEPVFHTLSTAAQEWACDQYARTDDLKTQLHRKTAPKEKNDHEKRYNNAPPENKRGESACLQAFTGLILTGRESS